MLFQLIRTSHDPLQFAVFSKGSCRWIKYELTADSAVEYLKRNDNPSTAELVVTLVSEGRVHEVYGRSALTFEEANAASVASGGKNLIHRNLPTGGSMTQYTVLLACGHWFRESRPPGFPDPADGEKRVCAAPHHYPEQYAAMYLPYIENPPVRPEGDFVPGDWQPPFFDWLATQNLALEGNAATYRAVRDRRITELLGRAWQAALKTVQLER